MGVREALKTQMVENAKSKEIIIELETAWLRQSLGQTRNLMKLKRAVVLLSKALEKVNRNRHIIDTETKAFKSKEKEIYNLEKKVNNQQDTSQWMKGDIAKLRVEIKG